MFYNLCFCGVGCNFTFIYDFIEKYIEMGCVPSKNTGTLFVIEPFIGIDVNKEVHASLLTSESHTDPEPHPVQKYVVSSRYLFILFNRN